VCAIDPFCCKVAWDGVCGNEALFLCPWVCAGGCPADLDGDGSVGITDLLALLGAWGDCPPEPEPCPADIDGDLAVGISDLLALLSVWGPCG
jgi:hypothetical protein